MSEQMVVKRAGSGSVTYPARSVHRCEMPALDGLPHDATFTCDCGKKYEIRDDERDGRFWLVTK